MRTVPFQSVLTEVAHRCGLDPMTNLVQADADALASHITAAYRTCYDYYPWPESTRVLDTEVTGTKTGNLIVHETNQPFPAGPQYQRLIGEILTITDVFPETAQPGRIRYLPWVESSEGFYLRDPDPENVFVHYRPVLDDFTATQFSPQLSYAAGSRVLFSDGRCYLARNAQNPANNVNGWEEIPFLYVLKQAAISGAMAHRLREEGQTAAAAANEANMEALLDQEVWKLERQGQHHRQLARVI